MCQIMDDAGTQAILSRFLAGDGDAVDGLITRLWPVVAVVAAVKARRHTGAAGVDDICQNTFLLLFAEDCRRLRLFDPARGTVEAYVAKIAANCATDYLRKHAAERGREVALPDDDILPGKDGVASAVREDWEVAAALGCLSRRERQVVELLFFEELDNEGVAKRMHIVEATVRSTKQNAIRKMRKFFGK